MLEPAVQIHRTLTSRNERKELLVLACEVDRTAWRQACRPPRHSTRVARDVLGYLQTFSSFLPGRWGRWVRSVSFVADLVGKVGWLRL
ncbi:MAG TPA: hypothetical protein VHN79_09860 [Lacunisphaera sp.]|nr:hypothetical protein [Lacunisphaera sp.]